MSSGIQVYDASGNLTFDSSVENILFRIAEYTIPASSVGGGLTYSFPAYAGKKISAFLQITSGDFSWSSGGLQVPSCRVTYPNGVPTVTVFFDNPNTSLPRANSYLAVFNTGASQ